MAGDNTVRDGAFEDLLRHAFSISDEVGREVEEMVAEEVELTEAQARALYSKVIDVLRRGAASRGDTVAAKKLGGNKEKLVNQLMKVRHAANTDAAKKSAPTGAQKSPATGTLKRVTPKRVFHGREVALYERRVSTRDIGLWGENLRLEVHLEQFESTHGRKPTNEELLEIMHGDLELPDVDAGIDENREDPFGIEDLADSIAKNGLRTPPILDSDGETLLDGNRRVAALYYLLKSPKYTADQKAQVQEITVYQLTEDANERDREAVIVSLNFEDDCKQDWPDYVRAKKVKADYMRQLKLIGQRNITDKEELTLRRNLAAKYALKMPQLKLYLNQMDWVERFEEYHIDQKKRDEHKVKHFAKNKWSYFKEVYDIRDTLDKDDEYRGLVFDIMLDGKVRNWETVRYLRHQNAELSASLRKARGMADVEGARELVASAAYDAYQRYKDSKVSVSLADKIAQFVEAFGKVPPKAYLDASAITEEDLQRLLTLTSMIHKSATTALDARQGRRPKSTAAKKRRSRS